MPLVKPMSGQTCLGTAQCYLEREGRALAQDYLNLSPPMEGLDGSGLPEYGECNWATVMDGTREKTGQRQPV